CSLVQVNPKADATIWHDGSKNKDMKFVVRSCRFDGGEGVNSWILARHHHDAQFYLLDCSFSKTMSNLPPKRVIYPIGGGKPSASYLNRNRDLDSSNLWGERCYFYHCHKTGGDYPWHADNLSSATGSPPADEMTPAWTFAGKWDPEKKDGPGIKNFTE